MTIHNPDTTEGVNSPVQKAVLKSPVKTAITPATKAAQPTEELAAVNSEKRLKAKKAILVRESFKLPMLDHLMLETLKLRSSKLGSPVKKSALVCAGINTLTGMSDAKFLAMIKSVAASRTGHLSKD
ncbi:MAG: hypothetical protein RLZZ371_2764 [Pseudomonadota bacterium]